MTGGAGRPVDVIGFPGDGRVAEVFFDNLPGAIFQRILYDFILRAVVVRTVDPMDGHSPTVAGGGGQEQRI